LAALSIKMALSRTASLVEMTSTLASLAKSVSLASSAPRGLLYRDSNSDATQKHEIPLPIPNWLLFAIGQKYPLSFEKIAQYFVRENGLYPNEK
jgi:hypothetical protein